jgi:hypothetical protein
MSTMVDTTTLPKALLLALVIATGGCSKSGGDALLVVDVTSANGALANVRRLEVTISTVTDGGPVKTANVTYPSLDGDVVIPVVKPVTLGVRLPGGTGEITVAVRAYGVGADELASGKSAPVTPYVGAQTTVVVALIANGDGGTSDGSSDGDLDGTAGAGGTTGAAGSAGSLGSGGIAGSGTIGSAGGGGNSGGSIGTAGAGAAGANGTGAAGVGAGGTSGGEGGAGGTTAACQASATQCSGNGVQTCVNGQWGVAVACGARQTCTGPVGTAKCTCNVDAVCKAVGSACDTTAKLAACSQDSALGCFFELTSTPCANGACSGAAGLAACCTNACATVGTQCGSSTSVQTCSVAANGCTASSTSTCSTGLVCERYASAACVDPTWAEWPMSNGPAEVAAGAPNSETYTDNRDGTITDSVTGLMWQKALTTGTFTQLQAVAFCPTLNLAGHNDWRLPSRIELVSIVDYGQSDPSIDTTYFPATPTAGFWSSSPVAGSPSSAWVVVFSDGSTNIYDITSVRDVRCVR